MSPFHFVSVSSVGASGVLFLGASKTSVRLIKQKTESEYFIAIIPPQPVYDEAMALKNYFNDNYQSKASLNSPPHITLHMPFKWKEAKEPILVEKLSQFAAAQDLLEMELRNFNCFPPRVIYIDVVANKKLAILQKELHRFLKTELNIFNANYKELPFHPHLTLAFRDLKKQKFLEAWDKFKMKKFEAVFPVKEIALLKHDGKVWKVFKVFKLLTTDY